MLLAPDADLDAELGKLRNIHLPTDQIAQVSTRTAYPSPLGGRSVVLFDFGLKHSILRELSRRGCAVTVVPWNISADRVRAWRPTASCFLTAPGTRNPSRGYRMWCENCRRSTRSSVFAWAIRSLLWLTVPIPISCVSAIAASTTPSASCRPVGSTSPARTTLRR
ncbi:carbamoyl-phosphate synthase [Cutibacterium acnes JCM 18918]|nr:carbamoyl-phosphate synthase [Cutibacterium acnes JCM 18918]